jgi:hypothetical protein
MLILGLFLLLLSWALLMRGIIREDKVKSPITLSWTLLLIGCSLIHQGIIKRGFSMNKYNVKKEVRREYINGQEIYRDTVYIFTLKK